MSRSIPSTKTARVAARRFFEYGTRFGSPAVPEVRATESPAPASRIHVRQVPGDPGGRADPQAPPQARFPEGMDLQPDPVAEKRSPSGQPEQHRNREPPQVIRVASKSTAQ